MGHTTTTRTVAIRLLLPISLVAVSFIGGAALQKSYGLGNLIKLLNPRHGTPPSCAVPDTYKGKLDIFILAGQSNMEGGGLPKEYVPLDTKNRVFVFPKKEYIWAVAREPLDGNMVGPGLAFAAELVQGNSTCAVGLVPCAAGGTNISKWQRNLAESSLYGRCLMKSKGASAMGNLAGILFLQGENDAEGKPDDHPHDWARMFERFATDIRQDLREPNLPIILAQIGQGNSPAWRSVQEQQASVKLDHYGFITTADLPYNPGNIHFTTASQMIIGKRFAEAYLKIAVPKTPPTSQPVPAPTQEDQSAN
ncbi:MAG: sialate O-acetylesterase [Planctomycetaceae bacterium]|nr:sialate O-acetylesterase [Planctomycetaceae bacterium]